MNFIDLVQLFLNRGFHSFLFFSKKAMYTMYSYPFIFIIVSDGFFLIYVNM